MTAAFEIREAVRDASPLDELVRAEGFTPKGGRNGEGKICCPLHSEKTPSCYIHRDFFHCFGCGEGGDVFKWVMLRKKVEFPAALEELADRAKIPLADRDTDEYREQTRRYAERARIENLLTKAIDHYHEILPSKIRQQQLREHYGFTDKTIDDLKIGWADGNLYDYLHELGVSRDEALATGLFIAFQGGAGQVKDFFENRIVFPYWLRGRVVYAIARRVEGYTEDIERQQAKYQKLLTYSEDRHSYVSPLVGNDFFWGEDSARGSDLLFITEGVTDAISAYQAGIPVISPVTVRFRHRDADKLVALSARAKKVVICNDNEENAAGKEGALDTARVLFEAKRNVRIAELPRPEGVDKIDVNEYLRDHSSEEFKAILEGARRYVDVLIDLAPTTPKEDRDIAITDLVSVVAKLPLLDRDNTIDRICKKFGLRRRIITGLIKEQQAEHQGKNGAPRKQTPVGSDQGVASHPYVARNGRTYLIELHVSKGEEEEEEETELANFSASITEELTLDDGAEQRKMFAISGALSDGTRLPEVRVPASEFAKMAWPFESWGATAVPAAGHTARDHLRAAIQLLSKPRRRLLRGHLGWARLEDGRVTYLQCGGAIGAAEVAVEIGPPLDRFRLPAEADDPRGAVLVTLDILRLGPPAIMYPLLGALGLAPLSSVAQPDFIVALVGETGTFKTEVAVLLQQHFGDFTRKSLPLGWTDTYTTIERVLFLAKDALAVIDDFVRGSDGAANRDIETKAQQVFRAVGNLHGRGRSRADLSQRPSRSPRSLVLFTGEDTPGGASTLGRAVVLRVLPGAIDVLRLTALQAQSHRFPHTMRAYIGHILRQLDEIERTVPDLVTKARGALQRVGTHMRQPDALGALYVGLNLFFDFAAAVGSLSRAEAEQHLTAGMRALVQVGAAQGEDIAAENPAARFVGAITTMLRTGRAVVLPLDRTLVPARGAGVEPIGWFDVDFVYLEPAAAQHAVARFEREAGRHWAVSPRALYAALASRQMLIRDAVDSRATPRRTLGGEEQRVLQIPLQHVGGTPASTASTASTGSGEETSHRTSPVRGVG